MNEFIKETITKREDKYRGGDQDILKGLIKITTAQKSTPVSQLYCPLMPQASYHPENNI